MKIAAARLFSVRTKVIELLKDTLQYRYVVVTPVVYQSQDITAFGC